LNHPREVRRLLLIPSPRIVEKATDDTGRQCLIARRLLEAGVRFVEVCHHGWDQHHNLKEDHSNVVKDILA
jgi:hypothetical protein